MSSNVIEVCSSLEKFEKNFESNINKFVEELCKEGVNHAKQELTEMDRYGSLGFTKSATRYELGQDNTGTILNNYILAPYVEFGTGVRGQRNQHPQASEFGWGYKINPNNFVFYDGKEGWWYPSTIDDPNTTRKPILDSKGNPTGQYIAFTQGMESRPFMHNTAKYLRLHYRDIAMEIFNND